jgi:hypothetical protein
MTSLKHVSLTVALFFAFYLLPGCSTSVLVNQWSDSSYKGPALNKIMVIAVRNDPTRRRVWEDVFIGELSRHGVNATQSYQLFPNAIPDSLQIAGAVAKYAFDGIIITRRLPKVVNTHYVNGYVTQESETKYSERKQRFFTYYRDVDHPGFVDTQKIANRSIDVWTTDSTSRMVWSAISETPEPATPDAVHRDVVSLVTGELERKGILPKVK